MLEFSIFVNFCKYGWVLNMRRDTNGKVLNIPGFRVCQVSAYASIAQGYEYARIRLNNALWQGFEYAWSTFHRVLNVTGLRI